MSPAKLHSVADVALLRPLPAFFADMSAIPLPPPVGQRHCRVPAHLSSMILFGIHTCCFIWVPENM